MPSDDDADRLTSQTLPGGRGVGFGYDPAGNLTSLTPPGRPPHEFDYTPRGLASHYRPPGAGLADSLTEYVYNLDGQLEDVLRPDGADLALAYHATQGRIERVSTLRGDAEFGYDAAGRLETLGSPDGVTLTYGYDGPIPTLETWSGTLGGTVGVTPDAYFRVWKQRVNGGHEVAYAYDHDGLVTQAGDLGIARRADNGLISGTTLGAVTTSETYNPYGESEASVARSGTDTLWRAVYGRDALGRIVGISENVLGTVTARTYGYAADPTPGVPDSGFLCLVTENGVPVERYGYDGNGNRTRFDATGYGVEANYDDQDRLVQYGDTLYAYTAAGELMERIVGSDTTRYSYDPLGNLLKVRFSDTDSVEYVVDGRNRRVARIANGDTTHRWLYQDQLEPVAEVDGAGAVVARYVYGTRGHVPDYVVKGGVTYRIVADHLGSVRLVVNAATGAIAQRLEYDAWGRVTEDTAPGFQAFGYAGGLWDAASGLVRFGARDYDARVGRWTSRDPIGFAGGATGLYEYVGNDPLNGVDPSGLLSKEAAMPRPPGPPLPVPIPRRLDPRVRARGEAALLPLGPRYRNAYEHALGGQYCEAMYGRELARIANSLKEFVSDPIRQRQRLRESLRDWWNFEMGVQGWHRDESGDPDSTYLWRDPSDPDERHYRP